MRASLTLPVAHRSVRWLLLFFFHGFTEGAANDSLAIPVHHNSWKEKSWQPAPRYPPLPAKPQFRKCVWPRMDGTPGIREKWLWLIRWTAAGGTELSS